MLYATNTFVFGGMDTMDALLFPGGLGARMPPSGLWAIPGKSLASIRRLELFWDLELLCFSEPSFLDAPEKARIELDGSYRFPSYLDKLSKVFPNVRDLVIIFSPLVYQSPSHDYVGDFRPDSKRDGSMIRQIEACFLQPLARALRHCVEVEKGRVVVEVPDVLFCVLVDGIVHMAPKTIRKDREPTTGKTVMQYPVGESGFYWIKKSPIPSFIQRFPDL